MSRYRPPPSASLYSRSRDLALRTAVSVSAMLGAFSKGTESKGPNKAPDPERLPTDVRDRKRLFVARIWLIPEACKADGGRWRSG